MKTDEQADRDEELYERGYKAAFHSIMQICIANLHDAERDAESWRVERAELVAALRSACDDFGDNDWPDNLNLSDVLNKHLLPYLYEAGE